MTDTELNTPADLQSTNVPQFAIALVPYVIATESRGAQSTSVYVRTTVAKRGSVEEEWGPCTYYDKMCLINWDNALFEAIDRQLTDTSSRIKSLTPSQEDGGSEKPLDVQLSDAIDECILASGKRRVPTIRFETKFEADSELDVDFHSWPSSQGSARSKDDSPLREEQSVEPSPKQLEKA